MLIWMQWRHVRSFFSCLKGDVTGAGRDVKRHCPRLSEEISDAFSSTETRSLFDGKATASVTTSLRPVSSRGYRMLELDWHGGWMDWGVPTCCLSYALIRIRCEWTWHCDMKGFHSLHVTSSYCINMPLMFHSDTGLLWCTSPKTNSSDKCTWLPCHDG